MLQYSTATPVSALLRAFSMAGTGSVIRSTGREDCFKRSSCYAERWKRYGEFCTPFEVRETPAILKLTDAIVRNSATSAGGLDALDALISELPALPASIFIVQHLAPESSGIAM
jgi:hypothetical protein